MSKWNLFFSKKKKKNVKTKKEIKIEKQKFFNAYKECEKIKNSNKTISYQKLIASVLLDNDLGFNSPSYLDFFNNYKKAIYQKQDLIFQDFIIHFNVNLKFSNDFLVPMIVENESTNNSSFNLKNTLDYEFNNFLYSWNQRINNFLNQDYAVEIFPNLIIKIDLSTYTKKVYFTKEFVVEINNKNAS